MTPAAAFWAVWAVLFLYTLTGAVDYGVTAFYLGGVRRANAELASLVDRYTAPVWETVNTLLIMFVVILVGFFPGAIAYLGTAMLLPGALGLALMAVRNFAFAFRKTSPGFAWLNAVAGLLSPLPFMAFFAILRGAGVLPLPNGGIGTNFAASLLDPLTLALMLVALTAELFLGGAFLAWYAKEQGRMSLSQRIAGTTGWLAFAALAALLISLPEVLTSATPTSRTLFGLALLAVLLAGVVSRTGRFPGWSFAMGIVGYALGFVALGLSQIPYIVRPYLTEASAFNNPAMLHDLLIVAVIGIVVIIPVVWLVARQVLAPPSSDEPDTGRQPY